MMMFLNLRSNMANITVLFFILLLSMLVAQNVLADNSQFPAKQKWFYGGGIGLGFGDVDYIEVSPLVGYNINPRSAVGVSLLYRYRKDKRFDDSVSTNDYGSTLFGRYFVVPKVYLQAEYEYLNYESYRYNGVNNINGTERTNFGSFLAGGGASMPVGRNASFYVTALYNFSYDKADSPYSEPIVIRLGVGVGF